MGNILFRWFANRSLTVKVLLPTLLVLVAAAVWLIQYMSQATRQSTIDESIATAKSTIEQFKILRSYYTTHVVAKVKKATTLDVSFDHRQKETTIPLPATMIQDLSEEFSRSEGGTRLKLYSEYPFPNRRDRVLDQFGEDALAFLQQHPDEAFVHVEKVDGAETTRVAIADRMVAQSCVDCHNQHASSPKQDWKLGDVRGVLEVSQPVERQLASNDQIISSASLIIAGSAAAIFVFVGLILRVVGARLKTTVRVMEAVATGDLSQALPDESRDEVGRMCVAVNRAVKALREAQEQERASAERERQRAGKERQQEQERLESAREMQLAAARAEQQSSLAQREEQQTAELRARIDELLATITRVEAGDLTQQASEERDDVVGQMAHGLNRLFREFRHSIAEFDGHAQTLAGSSAELSAVSTQMSANAEETSAQANLVSAVADQVSRNVRTAATGVEQMGASIGQIAENVNAAARVAQQAVKVAETTNERIAKLGDSSDGIGKVVKVITSIAEQTNLLALNATIEAARAGEAGKGFAVVANEVKELAKETARATEDIGQKIEAIQADTRGAVAAIGQIRQIIGEINDIAGTIASAVEQQTATSNEISRNVTEAATGSGEIAQNITSVAKAAQSTAEGASNTQHAAVQLSRMAAELQRLVGRFEYRAEGEATPDSLAGPRAAHNQRAGFERGRDPRPVQLGA